MEMAVLKSLLGAAVEDWAIEKALIPASLLPLMRCLLLLLLLLLLRGALRLRQGSPSASEIERKSPGSSLKGGASEKTKGAAGARPPFQ